MKKKKNCNILELIFWYFFLLMFSPHFLLLLPPLISPVKIQDEAEDLDRHVTALMAKETQQVQQELRAAKSQIETVVQEFENLLRTANPEQFNSLIRKSESAIASIVEAHCPGDSLPGSETVISSYTPQFGEQVHVKGLGDKLATVVEAPGDDETILVQYGKVRVRVKKSDIRAIPSNKSNATSLVRHLKRRVCTAINCSGEVFNCFDTQRHSSLLFCLICISVYSLFYTVVKSCFQEARNHLFSKIFFLQLCCTWMITLFSSSRVSCTHKIQTHYVGRLLYFLLCIFV